jgi:D-glycero-D-manno-heptose 1,7-bisphosphate phosphatase
MPTTNAVFLDRDGTLIAEPLAKRPENVRLLPGVPEGLRILKEAGFLLVVVSNQSWVDSPNPMERAKRTQKVHEVNAAMNDLLAVAGAPTIDAFYFCPHSSAKLCACRKPKPGLIIKAADELGIDLRRSHMVGNSMSDCIAAEEANIGFVGVAEDECTFLEATESIAWYQKECARSKR